MRSVNNGYRFDKNGWIYVHIEGTPYERGVAHGKLVVDEFKKMWESNEFITFFDLSEMHIQLRGLGAYRGSRLGDER